MTPEVTDFAGKFVKEADPEIIDNLKRRGLLYKKETITHSYPHCWRCKTPLLYYARASWYIETTKFAKKMVELNKTINWVPPEVGVGRFGNWLEDNKDWALSRDRFWGTPLNIWVCGNEKCGHARSVGSVEELRNNGMSESWNDGITERVKVPADLDLHKPFVDSVVLKCEKCGGDMKRTPELIDVWFDSGSMPFAQYHYPFENKEWFESHFPADYISEGIDQTRGWFYSMHAIATFLFGGPAYKSVISHELILDKDGQKMSKSKGNILDTLDIIDGIAVDALGLQSHMHQGYWGEDKTLGILERFSRYNIPIHFTETTLLSGDLMPPHIVDLNDWQVDAWPSTADGEARQADERERHYRTLLAHPPRGASAWRGRCGIASTAR